MFNIIGREHSHHFVVVVVVVVSSLFTNIGEYVLFTDIGECDVIKSRNPHSRLFFFYSFLCFSLIAYGISDCCGPPFPLLILPLSFSFFLKLSSPQGRL